MKRQILLKWIFIFILVFLAITSAFVNGVSFFVKSLLLYLLFVSNSYWLSQKMKRNFSCTIPLVFLLIIAIMYFFGLIHFCKYGIVFVIIVSIGLLIYNLCHIVKNKGEDIKEFFDTPGFYLFTFLYILLSISTRNASFFVWDEYSFWSIASKNMYYLDDFYTNAKTTLYSSFYPPSPTVLQYFICKFFGTYNQGLELFTAQLLGFSLLMPLLKNADSKKIIPSILGSLIILCLPAIFIDSTFYYTIYADALLGIMSGYVLFEYFTNEKGTYINTVLFLLLFCMTLTKGTGIIFSFIVFCIILIYSFKTKVSHKKKLILLMLLPIVLSFFSWKIHCSFSHTVYNNGYLGSVIEYTENPIIYALKNVVKTFALGGGNTNLSLQTFFYHFFDRAYYAMKPFALSASALIGIFIIAFVLTHSHIVKESDKTKFKWFSILLGIGSTLYILLIQCAYLVRFSEVEAKAHNSLQRYAGSMFLTVLIFVIGILFYYLNKSNKNLNRAYVILFAIIFCFTPIMPIANATVTSGIYNYQNNEDNAVVRNFSEFVTSKTKENDRILCIHQKQMNNANMIKFRYYMSPRKIIMTDPVAEKPNRLFLSIDSASTFERLLEEEFDYVAILESDAYFDANYSNYFKTSIDDWSLYDIDKQTLELSKIE